MRSRQCSGQTLRKHSMVVTLKLQLKSVYETTKTHQRWNQGVFCKKVLDSFALNTFTMRIDLVTSHSCSEPKIVIVLPSKLLSACFIVFGPHVSYLPFWNFAPWAETLAKISDCRKKDPEIFIFVNSPGYTRCIRNTHFSG